MARPVVSASAALCASLLLPLLLLAAPALAADGDGSPRVNRTLIFDAGALPPARPPLWPFRTLANATWSVSAIGNGYLMTVVHADLPGITAKMMSWLFANLASGTSVHPVDGKTYPNFLMMHPRDHARHTASKAPLTLGATTNWIEFPLTNCSQWGGDWVCPTAPEDNPGFTSATPVDTWQWLDQINGTSRVLTFSPNAVEFGSQGCNYQGCAWVVRTRQSWVFVKARNALVLTTRLRVGIGMPDNDINIVNGWRNGLDPLFKFKRMATHYVEEYGGLPYWLPAAYNASMIAAGKKP